MPTMLGIKDGGVRARDNIRQRDQIWIPEKKFSIDYYVMSDTISQTEDDVILTPGVPPLLFPLRGAICKGRDANEMHRITHPVTGVPAALWVIRANFDSRLDPTEPEDPTAKTPIVRWHGETEEEVLEEDAITGDPVETAAKEPILITTPFVMPVLEIRRYELYPFDPNIMLNYSHRTNSTDFWGAPEGTALMLPMEVDEETIENVKYCVVTYRIKFKIKPDVAEPWQARVLHHGFKYRSAAGAEPEVYMDKHGNPATVNLNDDGTLLPAAADAKFLTFNRFKKVNHNTLTLGPF